MPTDERDARFVERLKFVLAELDIPEVEWGGFLFGFAYRELRRNFSADNARALVDVAMRAAEELLSTQKDRA